MMRKILLREVNLLSIKFKHNWNEKINNDYFTTIRSFSEDKYNFYKKNLKNTFDVYLLGEYKRSVVLDHVGWAMKLRELPMGLLKVDTGLGDPFPLFEKFGIKKDSPVIVLTFSKEREEWNQIKMKL